MSRIIFGNTRTASRQNWVKEAGRPEIFSSKRNRPPLVARVIFNTLLCHLQRPTPLQVTADYFGEDVRPCEVFISATVDPASAFADACTHLGLNSILCRGHRLDSAVVRALGLDDDGGNTCENTAMKGLVGKCSSLLGLFSNSAVDNEALRDQAPDREKEVEDLLRHAALPGVGGAKQCDPGKAPESRCGLGKKAAVESVLLLLKVDHGVWSRGCLCRCLALPTAVFLK